MLKTCNGPQSIPARARRHPACADPARAMSAHASKRRLHDTHAESEYAPGAIKRVKLHNFMSYVDAEVHNPGPRLNCIVGPNGTGKSSIVNALAIGLGGSLRLTERGSAAEEAIKKDCASGYVEIELRSANGAGKNLVVRCDLKREGKKVDYSLDGARARRGEGGAKLAGVGRGRRDVRDASLPSSAETRGLRAAHGRQLRRARAAPARVRALALAQAST
jgi:hypothetical protein